MLETILNCELSILELRPTDGGSYYVARLDSEDAQILYIYEGQLKYISDEPKLRHRYRATFKPFLNNRWVDLRLLSLEDLGALDLEAIPDAASHSTASEAPKTKDPASPPLKTKRAEKKPTKPSRSPKKSRKKADE